eukprot:Blabericola_migrator_1__3645@NODE_2092_length_3290_cov_10_497983_g1326_i0_p3_GENE_NODE_2092_length_3290_cov_10_497983_g1326_i0NODE_2092_length_3290_cov_10_497983_g1326_i0_p3_ORF_typecomplete_len132_score20_01PDEase_I/PF00233_19/0_0096_NODE_2092_length_3290_cov_10_497983_g1326_i023182713
MPASYRVASILVAATRCMLHGGTSENIYSLLSSKLAILFQGENVDRRISSSALLKLITFPYVECTIFSCCSECDVFSTLTLEKRVEVRTFMRKCADIEMAAFNAAFDYVERLRARRQSPEFDPLFDAADRG